MNKKQFTISKLSNLQKDLTSITSWMNHMLEVYNEMKTMNENMLEYADTLIPILINQKTLYEQTINNIDNILNYINDKEVIDDDSYINHILLSTFNIANHIGNPSDLFDLCVKSNVTDAEETLKQIINNSKNN